MAEMSEVVTGSGQAVRIISLNTGGLNSPVKRTKILTYIKNLNADVFIQETHLCNSDKQKQKRPRIGQILHSKFNLKTRGTTILLRNVNFISKEVITDQNGRFVIVSGILYQKQVILVSVYAPNRDDHSSMTMLLSSIPNLNTSQLLLGSDLNCVINPALDRSSIKPGTPSKMGQSLFTFMDQYGYIDPWRHLHPATRQYSFYSHVHCSFSHIDYFIIGKALTPSIISTQYSPISVSDHSAVS